MTLSSLGCGGGDDETPIDTVDAAQDAKGDVKLDVVGDAPKGDATRDATPDSPLAAEAGPDVLRADATPDVAVVPEAGPDVTAAPEASPDVTAAAEAGPDAKPDVVAAPDAAPDVVAAPDAAPDAQSGLCGTSVCAGATPQCNTNNNTCVACLNNTQCTGANKVCSANACVQCVQNSDCTASATPVCNVSHVCVAAPTTLTSIEVTPTNPSAAKGTTVQFHATGKYSDNTNQDLTASVTWSSVVTATATIVTGGLAKAEGTGQSLITATSGAISGSTQLSVTAAVLVSIQVTPTTPSIAKGTQQQFRADGTFSDNTTQNLTDQVTWASSNTGVAGVNNAGLATGQNAGTTTIAATKDGKTGSTDLAVTPATIVSVAVSPGNPTIARNTTRQFVATATYSDHTSQVVTAAATWSSSVVSVATVSNTTGSNGLATGVSAGQTTLQATVNGVSGTSDLNVTGATLTGVGITPDAPSIAKGTVQHFQVIAAFSDSTSQDVTTLASWSSSDSGIATISNTAGSQGLATSVQVGTTNIGVTFGTQSATTTLEVTAATLDAIAVTPTNPSIAKGTTQAFTATGTYSDNSTQDLTAQASWGTGDSSIATIDVNGLAKGVNVGPVSVTASFGGSSGSTTLTVSPKTLLSIAVTPGTPSIAKGTDQAFIAIGTYSDTTTQDISAQASWTSSDTAVSVVTGSSAHGSGVGTATIIAALDGKSGSASLTVTQAVLQSVAVGPTNPSIAKGTTVSFTATGTYSDTTTQDLTALATWSSSSGAASVTGGVATGSNVGTATITATYTGIGGTSILTVTPATLLSIALSPTNPSIALGTDKQFTATGTYSDQSTQNLTALVTWESGTPATAAISNGGGSSGLATSVATGTTTIKATDVGSGIFGTTVLTVTPATLSTIEITPTIPSIAKGTTQSFVAIGHYSDATTQTLTTQVTWASGSTGFATISNAGGSEGVATGVGVGSSLISATLNGVSSSTTLTVTAATLQSLAITPANPSVANGVNLQFTVTGTYSDSSTQDLTSSATWGSTQTGVATVDNGGSKGHATSVSPGTTTISAVYGGVPPATTTLTVTPATVTLITVTPANSSIASGTSVQFAAVATFSDSTTLDVTSQATWSSTSNSIASISNASGSQGYATGSAIGSVTISANFQSHSGSTPLAVTTAVLTSISVTPVNPSLKIGSKLKFKATGSYSNNTTQDITNQVTWSSGTLAVATVSNAAANQGTATGVSTGSAVITATDPTTLVNANTTLTVHP